MVGRGKNGGKRPRGKEGRGAAAEPSIEQRGADGRGKRTPPQRDNIIIEKYAQHNTEIS